jgi:hypothetical protein
MSIVKVLPTWHDLPLMDLPIRGLLNAWLPGHGVDVAWVFWSWCRCFDTGLVM